MARLNVRRALRRIGRRNEGAAAVEFGLLLPVLVIMLLGVAEIGRLLFHYHTIAQSVEDGARYLTRAPGAIDCPDGATWLATADGNGDTPVRWRPNPVAIADVLEDVVACAREHAPVVTVSITGGEPLEQPEFVAALVRGLRAKELRVYLETAGIHADALRSVVT